MLKAKSTTTKAKTHLSFDEKKQIDDLLQKKKHELDELVKRMFKLRISRTWLIARKMSNKIKNWLKTKEIENLLITYWIQKTQDMLKNYNS